MKKYFIKFTSGKEWQGMAVNMKEAIDKACIALYGASSQVTEAKAV